MYLGDVNNKNTDMWICNEDNKFIKKSISMIDGLYKIFDEILVNANDNIKNDKTCKTIRVNITKNEISILNDGCGIEITIH